MLHEKSLPKTEESRTDLFSFAYRAAARRAREEKNENFSLPKMERNETHKYAQHESKTIEKHRTHRALLFWPKAREKCVELR